jgi:hypothetical protein
MSSCALCEAGSAGDVRRDLLPRNVRVKAVQMAVSALVSRHVTSHACSVVSSIFWSVAFSIRRSLEFV